MAFRTTDGVIVPAVTAEQMREVDRLAEEEFGLSILQMMENAGRNLALNVMDMLGAASGVVTVLAGAGGNGGGGLCCARHLHNRGFTISIILDREPEALSGAAASQLHILRVAGVKPVELSRAGGLIAQSDVVVDALIGYSLRGSPRGTVAQLIATCNQHASRILSLDVPSGVNATTGEISGVAIQPERTLTLALPKTGLVGMQEDLHLADIGIPPELYGRLGVAVEPFFGYDYWVQLLWK